MYLSIVIPTLNEADHIPQLIRLLQEKSPEEGVEILVVDGGSSDDTVALARALGVSAYVSREHGRQDLAVFTPLTKNG